MPTRRKFLQQTAAAAALSAGLSTAARKAHAAVATIVKPIPASGQTVPVIGLGTNRYAVGDPADNARLTETVATFVDNGGTVIDTAPMYRSSETILGRITAELGIRNELFLATKADRDVGDGGRERLANSFQQLQADTLDLVQSHNLRGVNSMLPVLREHKQDGRIRYIGITTSRVAQFPEFIDVMETEELDFIQVNYSLADREAEKRILPLAADKGMAVLVNLPLGRGRLFKTVGEQPVPNWAQEFDCDSWAQFFLKYVVSHPAVTCAIPGMTKARHAADNLGAARGRLPDAAQRRRQETWFASL